MTSTRPDSDRLVLIAAVLTGFIGLGLFLVILLTVMQYGQLNASGQTVMWIALLLTAATMLLALYLALAARSRALTSSGLSGAGWFIVAAGLVLAFPAMGASLGFANMPGVSSFSPAAGAIFLIIGGAGLLQAESAARRAAK